LDIIPAYASISIYYNVLTETEGFNEMSAVVEKIINTGTNKQHTQSRKLIIPVCYDLPFCLDGKTILKQKKISMETLIELHTSVSYKVFMLGFLPGFAYMGMVDERIAAPRLAKLRAHVPEGSIGIAGMQTGIYPFESPGGWNIIGRTPIKIFEPEREHPVLFQLGDEVTFVPISRKEFEEFKRSDFNVLQ
jgi:inhibitor of KinA